MGSDRPEHGELCDSNEAKEVEPITEGAASAAVDVQHRNRVLRAYFAGRTWDKNPEFQLICDFINAPHNSHTAFPLVFDFEWEVAPGHPNEGRGDLLLTDGAGRFAVVEAKHIDARSGPTARVKRTKSRGHVREQAVQYAWAVARDSDANANEVSAFVLTPERGLEAIAVLRRAPPGSTEPWVCTAASGWYINPMGAVWVASAAPAAQGSWSPAQGPLDGL